MSNRPNASRVAAAFLTANPEMDPDQAMNQLRYEFPDGGPVLASDEVLAGSDGEYMLKQNLWLIHQTASLLEQAIPDGTAIPDWAESKINVCAASMKDVAGWLMYEYGFRHEHGGGE
jgi:hypothetical protein